MVKPQLGDRSFVDLLGNRISYRKQPTREFVKHYLSTILKDISLQDLARLLTNNFLSTVEYMRLLGTDHTCQRMSLLFNPHRLDTRTSSSKLSIYQALKTDSYLDGLARLFLIKHDKIKENLLYMLLQFGSNGIGYVNEFPPHIARDLCRELGLGKANRVLDPCAGWGGRMIGVSTACDHYDGCEPATRTADGLAKLGLHLNALTGTFRARVVQKPFEDVRLPRGAYDFAITSPPYYDTEIYSDEETNSLNRYKTFEDWVLGFYYPLISRTCDALKPGRAFALNVGDRKYPLPRLLLEFCDQNGISAYKLPTRLAKGGGLRRQGEGEVFFMLRRENAG